MSTIRQKTEAEQAVTDFVAECWLAAKRHAVNPTDDVVERMAVAFTELAKESPLAKSFVEQRAKTLRAKRTKAAGLTPLPS